MKNLFIRSKTFRTKILLIPAVESHNKTVVDVSVDVFVVITIPFIRCLLAVKQNAGQISILSRQSDRLPAQRVCLGLQRLFCSFLAERSYDDLTVRVGIDLLSQP